MKKISMTIFCALFLLLPSSVFVWQEQEHEHAHSSLQQYEERLQRYAVRGYWQMPLRIMDELGIGPGMSVADVGAGIGYFTLKLSEKVGESGKVYASDIDENALAFLNERRKKAGLENITIIHGREENPLIPEVSVDLVLMVNTIQLVKEKSVFLNNIRDCLKEDGKLVFVQWDAEKMDSEAPGWNSEDREKYTMHNAQDDL